MELTPGQKVIIPTRYGDDLAVVLGLSKQPVGIKKSDIVCVKRIAEEKDLRHAEDLEKKREGCF